MLNYVSGLGVGPRSFERFHPILANVRFGIKNPECGIRNPMDGIQDPFQCNPFVWNLEYMTHDPGFNNYSGSRILGIDQIRPPRFLYIVQKVAMQMTPSNPMKP